MKPSSAKAKGRSFQQFIRDCIYDTFPDLTDGDVRSTSMGAGGEDLQLSPAARASFPYSVECKANKSFAVYKIMEQAQANSPEGSEPLVMIKGDRRKPLAVVHADHFFQLLKGRNT